MDLLANPFHILGVTTHDDRQRIENFAEERSLLSDTDACQKAREALINPRKRIAAEVAWLPGVDPDRASDMVLLLKLSAGAHGGSSESATPAPALIGLPYSVTYNIADKILESLKRSEGDWTDVETFLGIGTLTPLARANLLAARIARLPDDALDTVADWILAIAHTYQRINPDEVRSALNTARQVSGFPEISDLSTVEAEIRNRRSYYQQVIQSALERLTIHPRVKTVTAVIERATNNGTDEWPTLIEDTVESYEDGVAAFLEDEAEKLKTVNRDLHVAAEAEQPDETLAPLAEKLICGLKNWGHIARPIQQSKRRQGLRHNASHDVVNRVQRLAVYLFKDYDQPECAKRILCVLPEIFAEVPEIVARVTADIETVETLTKRQQDMVF